LTEPFVSVLTPARNEENDIRGCVEAIAAQRYPTHRLEWLLIDGDSTDGTVRVARETAARHGLSLRVVGNIEGTAAHGLNAGIAVARGDIIVRVDARARVGVQHVARCVELFAQNRQFGVVGGGQMARARRGATLVEKGIARSLRNRYTTGFARYRRGGSAGPTDTVWMGAFKRDDVLAAGGWPTEPAQNQDFRLNQTLRRNGLIVWFDPSLTAGYLPRRDLFGLARQYLKFGRAKGTIWKSGELPNARQTAILVLPFAAAAFGVLLVRRVGVAKTALVGLVIGSVLDQVGNEDGAPLAERTVAVVATMVSDGSWLAGVLRGIADQCRH
jgi:succinoglycan biosynthesis protein ExoA